MKWDQVGQVGHGISTALADFFLSKSTFMKSSFMNTTRLSNSLDPGQGNVLSGMIGVQTVCKGYQQTILVGQE